MSSQINYLLNTQSSILWLQLHTCIIIVYKNWDSVNFAMTYLYESSSTYKGH